MVDKSKLSAKKANICCSNCKKCAGGCSWSDRLEPIDGWKAEKTFLDSSVSDIQGYKIHYCPEFEDGDPLDDTEMNDEGALRLLERIVELSANEFKVAAKEKLRAEKQLKTCRVALRKSLLETIHNCKCTMDLNRVLLGKHCKELESIAIEEFIEESAKNA